MFKHLRLLETIDRKNEALSRLVGKDVLDTVTIRYTHCELFILSDDRLTLAKLARGTARCSPRDNFCKETGRKVALADALKKSDLKKADREIVWKWYKDMWLEVRHEDKNAEANQGRGQGTSITPVECQR